MSEINTEPTRSWQTSEDDSQMRCYLGMKGRVSIGELIDHFKKNYPHVDPMKIELNYATAVWEEAPTVEDLSRRARWRAEKAARLEAWERETYIRLKKKFARKFGLAQIARGR